MVDKFEMYYCIIDTYDLSKKDDINLDFPDYSDVDLFFSFCPFNMTVLMRYLENTINKMCDELVIKEKVEKEIENFKKYKNDSSIKILKDYNWKNISLLELLKGNFSYLYEKFVVKHYEVPDNNSFIKNYCYPGSTMVYPFSLKELYDKLILRGITITINNYYFKKDKKSG